MYYNFSFLFKLDGDLLRPFASSRPQTFSRAKERSLRKANDDELLVVLSVCQFLIMYFSPLTPKISLVILPSVCHKMLTISENLVLDQLVALN